MSPAQRGIWLTCLMGMVSPGFAAADSVVPEPEAAEAVQQHDLFFSAVNQRDLLDIGSLRRYLLQQDRFADALTPEEYARFKEVHAGHYAGIGLELERDSMGNVYCYPDAKGPAARAGVKAGDRLLAIGDESVEGRGLPTLVALAAGAVGTPVILYTARDGASRRRFAVTRSAVTGPSVSERRYAGYRVVRIASFTPDTRQELEFIASRNNSGRLILDLRGNRGGDLHAAIDCAMLFLPEGAEVVSVESKQGVQHYVSTIAGRLLRPRVFLLQDSGTASAAEVFIAALTGNHRAVSIGTPTFGKGTQQQLIALSTGAVLILTTGYLLTPQGRAINGVGLAPDRASATGIGAYLAEVR